MTKKLLYVPFLLLLILATGSCKKKSTSAGGEYYVRITRNGAVTSYPTVAGELGPDLGNPAYTDLGVSAQSADASDRLDISIQVTGSSLPVGSYDSGNFTYQTIFDLTEQSGATFQDFRIDDAIGMPPSRYIVNITSITADAITGTFTGNYLTDFSSSTLALTYGEFHVKRVR